MSNVNQTNELAAARRTIRALEEELAETNRGLVALTLELEQRVDERTQELQSTHDELQKTNSELLQLTLELDERVAARTAELQTAAESLRASEERFRLLAENAQDIIYAYRLAGTPGFEYVSPSVTRVLGYTPEDHYREPTLWNRVVHPDDVEMLSRLIETPADEPGTVVIRWKSRDQKWKWAEHQSRPVRDAGGRRVAVEGIARDITDRKNLEDQLHQSQKMEAIGQLAGGVAHDFNNLLTVISGYSTLLIDQLPAGSSERAAIDEIHRAAERAAALTRQLLMFSRRQVVTPKHVGLNQLIGDLEKMLRRLIGEDIQFVTALAPDLCTVCIDPGQIEQLVMNLAVNARDAMPNGGRLVVETANVELDDTYTQAIPDVRPGAYVLLAVSDSGRGMSNETKRRVFEPFFTTKATGTGLGLATVYGIVKQNNGHISVYSEPGQGTSFKVYLPRIVATPGAAEPETPVVSPIGTETVLVVEDEAAVRSLVKLVLESNGYRVLEATNGQAGLQAYRDAPQQIDMVITDVVMPNMSGRQMIEEIRQSHPGVKVLYLSGYTDDAVLRAGVIGATDHFLQKPFTPSRLAGKVREVLDA